ncbi:unnamed protein product, partial [Mesorhabditis spiculigera]
MAQVAQKTLRTRKATPTGCEDLDRYDLDKFLYNLGLVRKTMPSDGSGVYRSACEMVTGTQNSHATLKRYIETGITEKNPSFPLGLCERERNELILTEMSSLLRRNIVLYEEDGTVLRFDTPAGKPDGKELMFCYANSGLEAIYKVEEHVTLAVAQAVTYKILYNGVFEEPRHTIRYAISSIREDIDHNCSEPDVVSVNRDEGGRIIIGEKTAHSQSDSLKKKQRSMKKCPPVPFSACKSLDPSIYRNVAFDLFIRGRRDHRANPTKGVKSQVFDQAAYVGFPVGASVLVPDYKKTYHLGLVTEVVHEDMRRVQLVATNEKLVASVHDLVASRYEPGCKPPSDQIYPSIFAKGDKSEEKSADRSLRPSPTSNVSGSSLSKRDWDYHAANMLKSDRSLFGPFPNVGTKTYLMNTPKSKKPPALSFFSDNQSSFPTPPSQNKSLSPAHMGNDLDKLFPPLPFDDLDQIRFSWPLPIRVPGFTRQLLDEVRTSVLLAKTSILADGSDLPQNIDTLRFFYNVGYEAYKRAVLGGSEKGMDFSKTFEPTAVPLPEVHGRPLYEAEDGCLVAYFPEVPPLTEPLDSLPERVRDYAFPVIGGVRTVSGCPPPGAKPHHKRLLL